LIIVNAGSTPKAFDLDSGELALFFVGHEKEIRSLAVTPDWRTLYSGSWDNDIRRWNIETGECEAVMMGHQDYVGVLAVSPDGTTLVSGSGDNRVGVWDLRTNRNVRMIPAHDGTVTGLAITPDGKSIISGSVDGELKRWWLRSGGFMGNLTFGEQISDLAITPDGLSVLAGGGRKLRLWQPGSGRVIHEFRGVTHNIHSLAMVSEYKAISVSYGIIERWDLEKGGTPFQLQTHNVGWVQAVAVTKDGGEIITFDMEGVVTVMNMEGKVLSSFPTGRKGGINTMALTELPKWSRWEGVDMGFEW
jgi:WD40 repeat protein